MKIISKKILKISLALGLGIATLGATAPMIISCSKSNNSGVSSNNEANNKNAILKTGSATKTKTNLTLPWLFYNYPTQPKNQTYRAKIQALRTNIKTMEIEDILKKLHTDVDLLKFSLVRYDPTTRKFDTTEADKINADGSNMQLIKLNDDGNENSYFQRTVNVKTNKVVHEAIPRFSFKYAMIDDRDYNYNADYGTIDFVFNTIHFSKYWDSTTIDNPIEKNQYDDVITIAGSI